MTTIGSFFLAETAMGATPIQTLPITIPQNSYFVASNLIAAVEYLHRAFPEHPDVYTREGNVVFKYIDPISGNITDVVDVSDLYHNAKSLSDVVIGMETVMFNSIPNPDTAVIPDDSIANLKLATNYITNIASYDFSSSDQAIISSFYNFTVSRYQNLFKRDNTTALIPFKPLSLTNNPQATTVPTPLYFNVSIFDAIDGPQLSNTTAISASTQTNMVNLMVSILQAYGLPVEVINGSNPTTTSAIITPTPTTTIFTTPEPTVSDPNDDGGFGRRRRHGRRNHQQNLFPRTGTPPPSPITPFQIVVEQNAITLGQNNQRFPVARALLSSARANIANSFEHAVIVGTAVKTVANYAKIGVQAGLTAIGLELGKSNSFSEKVTTIFVKAGAAVVNEILNDVGDLGGAVADFAYGIAENDAMRNALTIFFGADESLANRAIETVRGNPSLKTATTFAKTMYAVRLVASFDPNRNPDLQKASYEDIIGARVDRIVDANYKQNSAFALSRFTKVSGLSKKEGGTFPQAEFDSLRTVMEGVTDHVATEVEFDEEKFLGGLNALGFQPEETFGYYVTAAKGIDTAVTTIAALTTTDADTKDISNGDFLEAKNTELGQGNGKGLAGSLKQSQQGKNAMRALAKNLLRARAKDTTTGELKMDEQAMKIFDAIGGEGFKAVTTNNIHTTLRATAGRGAIGSKNVINSKNRAIFNNKRIR
ncbi:hypothetical protein HDU76_004587 [Blyttiomyces sp. JEL0837]|nr:hypothetical protein HDU76_004587 [Blyttiomyces sp. JEL0837]